MDQLKNNDTASILYKHPLAVTSISDALISVLPEHIHPIIVLCIGSDRSTGDALGPMTGTFLKRMQPKLLQIYGSLSEPIHALNLDDTMNMIKENEKNAFVIALDASLGYTHSIGHLQYGSGSILPGSALKKELPPVGDAFITGIVNISGMMEFTVLQSTRLSLVYDMARIISKTLYHIDITLQKKYYHMMHQTALYIK